MLTYVTRNEEQWDAFTLAHGGGFLQSWGWAQFQEALGREVFRFRIDAPGDPRGDTGRVDTIAQCTMIYHGLPFGRKYAYVPRGPVVDLADGLGDKGRTRLETCVSAIRTKIADDGAVFARVEWPFERGSGPVSVGDLDRWGFAAARAVQPADTVIIDLTKTEDALLAAMRHKTRYNIRLAERHGVVVREVELDNAHLRGHDIDLFWSMLSETAGRDKFHTHPKEYYRMMLEALSSKKRAGLLRVRLRFAEHAGRAVAAALLAEYGDTVTYLHGASLAEQRNVMAPYLLHWTVARDAKRAGFRDYDLWGVAPSDDAEHPWAGITRFKTGFGGRRVGYLGAWELPGDKFWYSLYRYAKRFRNI